MPGSSLWQSIIRDKYDTTKYSWWYTLVFSLAHGCGLWKGIMTILPEVYIISDKEASIQECLMANSSSKSWNLNLWQNLYEWEIGKLIAIMGLFDRVLISEDKDSITWEDTVQDFYTKKAYYSLEAARLPSTEKRFRVSSFGQRCSFKGEFLCVVHTGTKRTSLLMLRRRWGCTFPVGASCVSVQRKIRIILLWTVRLLSLNHILQLFGTNTDNCSGVLGISKARRKRRLFQAVVQKFGFFCLMR